MQTLNITSQRSAAARAAPRAPAARPVLPVRASRTRALVRAQAAAAAAPATVSRELQDLSVNAIRFLAVDAINKSKSGHPGLPMGCAPMTYVMMREAMQFNPKNPQFFNRDRFVLSAGHGSMLQYAMLHLLGYDSVSVSGAPARPAPARAAAAPLTAARRARRLRTSSSSASGAPRPPATPRTSSPPAWRSPPVGGRLRRAAPPARPGPRG
jgi:hypothetical protein